ncbi:MAG: hypothetical protein ABIT09_05040 [Croceibacterium sp.]
MTNVTDSAVADRLGRRRARLLPVMALVFLTQQMAFFANPPAERLVDHVRIGAWVMLSVVLLVVLQTGGGWFRSRAVRAMLNDEATLANRANATQWGFLTAMAMGIVLYVLQGAAPMGPREVIHLIVSAGLIAALIRFGMLERRGYA